MKSNELIKFMTNPKAMGAARALKCSLISAHVSGLHNVKPFASKDDIMKNLGNMISSITPNIVELLKMGFSPDAIADMIS